MPETEDISLSITEDRLSSDADGQFKKEVIHNLKTEITDLTATKQGGLSPEEFQQTDALIKALGSAIKVTEMTWLKFHGASGTP
ncbi:MAG: hypothetical protein KAG53_06620 [Endozoicomonadaceae bacterium]|nr:hypothetical protein [Endozoicomonadaceae bacterium]